METVFIYNMLSSIIFQEIEYIDFNDLSHKLNLMIIYHDCDILMQLLINDEFLNNFYIIDI